MKKWGVIFAVLILALSFVSASYIKGNLSYSIPKDYGPGDILKGWINLSFSNQASNSFIETSLGGISLFDLIKKTSNLGFVYSCTPLECTSNYISSSEGSEKTFELGENESVFFGFKISGKNVGSFSGFTLNITSTNPETEKLPLAIDFLNDGQKEWQAYNASNNFGPENFGCFLIPTGQAFISKNSYCEKINLKKTPEVEIGAYVNYITGNKNVDFQVSIQNVYDGTSKSCVASASGSGRISCVPFGFQIKENGDYFVCLATKFSGDINRYKIDYEQERTCGFSGLDYQNADGYYDFEIFARPKKYSSNINIKMDTSELIRVKSPVTDLSSYMEDYVKSEYANCSKGCIIPVKITSGIEQQITISGMKMFFIRDGIAEETDSIFSIQETPAGISSGFQKLYIDDLEFKVPKEYGNYTLSFSMDNNSLFSADISVGEVPTIKSVTPLNTAVKYPTQFKAEAKSSKNITQYTWDFGDSSPVQTTTTGEVSHTYNTAGKYSLKIGVMDTKGKGSTKEFSISVGPASEIVPSLLAETEANFVKVKSQIVNFSQFEQKSISAALNLNRTENDISQLKTSLAAAATDQDYETILGTLLAMKLPDSVARTTSSSGISFYPESGIINPGTLEDIIPSGNYDSGKDGLYKDAILGWGNENVNIIMDFNEISSVYRTYESPFLKVFNVHVTKSGSDSAYIIIKDMQNLLFKEDYSEKSINGYTYIDLSESEKDITFSTTENVDFITLPMFISPSLDRLTIADFTEFEEKPQTGKWIGFTFIILLILAAALGVYTFLQVWYTRKYETTLFKDRNNLLNLINYIHDAKKKEDKDDEIMEKLKKSGWNSEQLRYAFKKYAGKNTGLPEIIPIGRILDAFQKKKLTKPVPQRPNPQSGNFPKKI